jgi:3-hydroxy-3-methylglutaryl CoA synthase
VIGIVSIGTHLPRWRLNRAAAVEAMSWFAPSLVQFEAGTRSVCHFDEDPLTMAVSAARLSLKGIDKKQIEALYMASTTLPFEERPGSAIMKSVLGLPDTIFAADVTDTRRAATTSLLAAINGVETRHQSALVVAADQRVAQPGSPEELLFGDGAAALVVGKQDLIAAFLGSHTITQDMVDRYRQRGARFDYNWEERWISALGYENSIPKAISGLLETHSLSVHEIDTFIYPCPSKRTHAKIGAKLGAAPEQIADNLFDTIGETGVAHPLVMLSSVLGTAKPGQRIVVAGFGSGAEAVLLEVTDRIETHRPKAEPRRPREMSTYTQFLAFRNLLHPYRGMRDEKPQKTALSVLFREQETIMGLVGGKCTVCGTPQFPRGDICVHPACRKPHTQKPYPFAHRRAVLKTFTGDYLGPSPCPPNIYGLIQFEGGGRMMAELTDCDLEEIRVGTPVTMTFRKRYQDTERGFTGYFWKAVPDEEDLP